RSARNQRIARAGLHQRLEHALVRQAHVEDFAQRLEGRDPPAELCAGVEDRPDGAFTQALDGREAETNAASLLDREVQLTLVEIWRQHGNPALAAFPEVHRELVGVL